MNEPTATLLPRILKTPIRLVCRNGWNDNVTAAFKKDTFEQLILQGTKNQAFNIPPLGAKSGQVEQLQLKAAGDVDGLEQFSGVLRLGIDSVPKNGIDLEQFPLLQSISFEWDKRIAAQFDKMTNLTSFSCDRYAYQTLAELAPLTQLQYLGIGRGRLRSLHGIDCAPKLRSVSIGDLHSFDSIDELLRLNTLSRIWLNNLPKLETVLELRCFDELEIVYIVNTALATDFTEIGRHRNLETVWLNGNVSNLDWDELLAINSLKKVGIVVPNADDLPVGDIAERAGRNVEGLKVVGPKGSRQIQLNLA